MSSKHSAITLLSALLVAVPALAQPPAGYDPPSELSFLTAGKDYVIRFPEGHNIFKTTRSEVTQATVKSEGRIAPEGPVQKTETRPATWTINYSVQVFHVVRFGGGSWVLLRHPANVEDAFKWFGHRRALAILASEREEEIRSEPDGEDKLARLREAAEREIETAETWVNLNHAVAITDVPTEKIELKASVRSIKSNPQ